PAARRLGVRVACVPDWEWLHPCMEWLNDVDLMLCPTRYTAGLLSGWTQRFGFTWRIECVPWPVDVERFRYRQRLRCRRFVFAAGTGGAQAVRPDGAGTLRRKGLEVLIESARRIPEIPIIVYADPAGLASPPPNVELRPPPADNTRLYRDGDV